MADNDAGQPRGDIDTAIERIELALDSGAILGTFVWDVPSDRFTGDERFARAFGFDPARIAAGMKLGEVITVIHPEDLPRVETLIAETVARGGRFSTDYRVRQLDGSYRWVVANGRCDHDPAGTPTRFPGILVDIDDRRRAEDRLRQSEAQAREATSLLRAVIEAVPALIYVKDQNGRMRIANRATLDFIGKPWEEVEDRTDADFLDDAAQGELVRQTDLHIMRSGASEVVEETVGHDAIGPRTWLSYKSAFRNDAGEVVGLVGTSTEITARKRAELALTQNAARLRRVLDNLFAFVGICDLDGHLLEANRAPVEGAGINFEDVIGAPVWDTYWFSYDPMVQARMRDSVQRAAAGHTVRFDLTVRWRDDSRLIIDYQIAPLRDESGRIVELIPSGVDITARVETGARLQEALDQRHLLIRELNHRVKNLFAVLSGMINATARASDNTREMSDRLRGRILALARAHELIQPALAAEWIDQSVELASLIDTILAPHLGPQSEQVRIEGPPVLVAPSAATALALTLHELATNAIKYGALSDCEGRIEIAWRRNDKNLILTWAESGGPPVEGVPTRTGFGSQLARLSASGQLAGSIEFDWRREGVHITLAMSLAALDTGTKP